MMENLTLSKFQKLKKSKFGWSFNIMDGLGWILKIFKQNHQKRQEARAAPSGPNGLEIVSLWMVWEGF